MKESKYERRRRRLVLREARLSNVTERYTEETAPLEELRAPHGSPRAAPRWTLPWLGLGLG